MLSHLSISNYALIEKLDMDFPRGFITITGETGAGKSVLLQAIGLLMGKRADTSSLNYHDQKCIIEGTFEVASYKLQSFFTSLDLDYEDSTIIRREITPSGKSRAFLNDTPVSLKMLKQVGERLMDIHAQFSSLKLMEEEMHLTYLDQYAVNGALLEEYREAYTHWRALKEELRQLHGEAERARKEEDYLRYTLTQLQEAKLESMDQEELEASRKMLENSETIKTTLFSCASRLVNEEENLVSSLKQLHKELLRIAPYSSSYEELARRMESIAIEADDMGSELDALNEALEVDPQRLEEVNALLDRLYRLQHKFHVSSVSALIEIRDDTAQQLRKVSRYDDHIKALEKAIDTAFREVCERGEQLTARRREASTSFAREIAEHLAWVNLDEATFFVSFDRSEEPEAHGFDYPYFMFSANKGIPPAKLGKVASGGELSRIMLAVKAVISKKTTLPAILFDEIETGVSGAAAGKIASLLMKMGERMQVITITHLPQIASKGMVHYKVSKHSDEHKTISCLKRLSHEERIHELASMLSNGEVTAESFENAKSMLE
ncbi:MAG: DNA repair protein RecN [Bacteroidetes bacterium]|nr:MAG: DNA repair protein RecN [Bacteroidota bacterium]